VADAWDYQGHAKTQVGYVARLIDHPVESPAPGFPAPKVDAASVRRTDPPRTRGPRTLDAINRVTADPADLTINAVLLIEMHRDNRTYE
jgi:hypothetical protein